MTNPIQPKFFVSYAHADGETAVKDFVLGLQEYLKSPERPWEKWDDKQIKVGEDWDKTIQDALQQGCNCCLLLLSDLFAKSSYIVAKEWPRTLRPSVWRKASWRFICRPLLAARDSLNHRH